MGIRWGHFTDLHFQFTNFKTDLLRDSLLERLKIDKIELDYIIITGDIFHKGNHDEESENFIRELANITKCDFKNIVMCPGNHDGKRSSMRKVILKSIIDRAEKNSNNIEIRDDEKKFVIDEVFQGFYNVCEKITGNKQEGLVHKVISCDDINIYILNTAIFAGQTNPEEKPTKEELEKEDKCLYICDKTLYELNKHKKDNNYNKKALNIIIAHHGVQCFVEKQRNELKNFLDALDIDLYLCGHVHSNVLERLQETKFMTPQISCGGLFNDEHNEPTFIIGEFNSLEDVKLTNYAYVVKNNNWTISTSAPKPYDSGVYSYKVERLTKLNSVEQTEVKESNVKTSLEFPFKIYGYTLLAGRGSDGIKYYWNKNGQIIESMAFNKRLKTDDPSILVGSISGYTSSISYGCILTANSRQCKFCETGNIGFKGYLTSEEIAFQNIFMAEYDTDCPSFPNVRNYKREFAYMGQGEPGHAYHIIRKAIVLTDVAMDIINQKVERHIISTSGITGFIPLLINDIKNGIFKNKVTVHFSLNAIGEDRNFLMPINEEYNYKEFIKECKELYACTKEKIGVGILMFSKFKAIGNEDKEYTLTEEKLKRILEQLECSIFKIDLCDYNETTMGQQFQLSNEYANNLLNIVQSKGFEGKLFSSFGTEQQVGCGMLNSVEKNCSKPGNTTREHYNKALLLFNQAKQKTAL